MASSSLDWTRLRSVKMASRRCRRRRTAPRRRPCCRARTPPLRARRLFEDETLRRPSPCGAPPPRFSGPARTPPPCCTISGVILACGAPPSSMTRALTIGPEVGAELSARDGTERAEEQPSKHRTTHGATHRSSRVAPSLAERRARRRARHARVRRATTRAPIPGPRTKPTPRSPRSERALLKRRGRARTTTIVCPLSAASSRGPRVAANKSDTKKRTSWLLVRGPSRPSHRHARTVPP